MELDWSLCRTFLAIARRGSLSAAARELGQSHPTMRRQLDGLEASAQATLFTRSPDGLRLTPLGARLVPFAEEMEAAAGALARAATPAGEMGAGVVRIAAPELVCVQELPRVLAVLRAAHPGLAIELVASEDGGDLLRREADVSIRFTRPSQLGLVASRIGSQQVKLHASSAWIVEHGEPSVPGELLDCQTLIGEDRRNSTLRRLRAHGLPVRRSHFALMVDSDATAVEAVRAGLGIGFLPVLAARRLGGLSAVLPTLGFEQELWLATHPDLRRVPQVRAVLDGLREGLRAHLACR